MSYPGGKQQAPLIQQGGNYPQIYPPQVYSYDKSEVGGGGGLPPDVRGPAMSQQGRYPGVAGPQRIYGAAAPQPEVAAGGVVAYQSSAGAGGGGGGGGQQPQPQLMRPSAGPANTLGYGHSHGHGQRAGASGSAAQSQMSAPRPPYQMNVPPPPNGPPFMQGPQQQGQNVLYFVPPGNRAVMPNSNMPNSYMPVPYGMQFAMPTQAQAAHGYQQPLWPAQQVHYMTQQHAQQHAQRPMQPMPPQSVPSPAASAPAPRTKRIAIINPDTGKEISVSSTRDQSARDEKKDDTSAAQAESSGISAEFAKMVAQAASEGARHSRAASASESRSRTTSETAPAAGAAASASPSPSAPASAATATTPSVSQVNGALSSPETAPPPAASAPVPGSQAKPSPAPASQPAQHQIPAEPDQRQPAEVPRTPVAVPETPAAPAAVPETPAAPAAVPETPAAPAAFPETLAAPAAVPETPAAPAAVPETPAAPAAVPETPAAPAAVPETPAAPAAVPETPAAPAAVPETPAAPVAFPETPAALAAVPETPAAPAALPETPAASAGVPETPAAVAAVPETPAALAAFPETPAAPAAVPETTAATAAFPETPAAPAAVPETPTAPAAFPEIPAASAAFPETPAAVLPTPAAPAAFSETPAPSVMAAPASAATPSQKPPPILHPQPPAPLQHREEEQGRQQHKKTKSKQKMRELSRRAEGRETGGDMDAFVDTKPSQPGSKPPPAKPAAAKAAAPAPSSQTQTPPATAKPPQAAAAPPSQRQTPPVTAKQGLAVRAATPEATAPAACTPTAPAAGTPTVQTDTAELAPSLVSTSTAAAPATGTPAVKADTAEPTPSPVSTSTSTPAAQIKPAAQSRPVTESKIVPETAAPEPEPAAAPEKQEPAPAPPVEKPEPEPAAPAAAPAPTEADSPETAAPDTKETSASRAAAPAESVREQEEAAAPEQEAGSVAPVAERKPPAAGNQPAPAGTAETAEKTADDTLEEGEIRDDDEPAVNGEEDAPAQPQTTLSPWQLELDRMKAESIAIGRKMSYNREDLMKLMGHPLSQKRPDKLPDLPSIVKKDRTQVDARAFAAIKSRSMGPTTGMPDYSTGFKPLPSKGYRGGRGSQQGRREMQGAGPGGGPPGGGGGPPRAIQISLNRDVRLKTSENAWKPNSKDAEPEDDEAKIIRLMKGILNKLTPNNRDKMIVDIKKLELNKMTVLQKMISTLFEKAVDEPMYADQYAFLCLTMAKTEVEGTDGKPVTFRKLLLTQCQTEFEKDKSGELNREERLKEIAQITDEQTRKEKKHLLHEEARKMRMRSNGNIHFIGELYKLGMLTDNIMHQCILKLCRDKHQDSYECLCKLMTTIGEKLELSERKRGRTLDKLFIDLGKISQDRALPSRIRFMLQDLIDMRNNNWVNTRNVGQAKPMTLEEVHKLAALQQAKEQSAVAAQLDDRRRNTPDTRGPDRRGASGGRPSRSSQGAGGQDGWNPVNRSRFDPGRVMNAINTGATQLESMRFGPGGGGGPGSGWSLGSKRSGGSRPAVAAPATSEVRTSTNIFAVLNDDEASGAMSLRLAPGGGRPRAEPTRGSQERTRGSQEPTRGSQERTARPPGRPAAPSGPQLKGPASMDEDKMKGKASMICEEYIANRDVASAVQDVEEHLHANTTWQFVSQSLLNYVDARTTEQRHLVGDLHGRLLESGHLASDAYLRGVTEMLELATDLAPDIPSIWANIGEMLAPPVLGSAGGVSLDTLVAPAAPLIKDGCGPQFVVALLKRLVSLKGANKVRALVPANQDWGVYFGTKDHVQLLVTADLGFLVAGANVPLPVAEAPESKGVRSLLSRVQTEPDLPLWVNRNVPDVDRRSPQFVNDFVCALCFDAIVIDNGAKKAVLSCLEKHTALLKCLICEPPLELAALHSVTTLVRHLQFPPGVLDQIFRQLYDMEVISEQTFHRWRDGNHPADQEGIGVALMSVQSFFQALEEAAEGGDEDEDEPRSSST